MMWREGRCREARLASLGPGRLALLACWEDAQGRAALLEAHSRDGGRSWSEPRTLDPSVDPAGVRFHRGADALVSAWLSHGERGAEEDEAGDASRRPVRLLASHVGAAEDAFAAPRLVAELDYPYIRGPAVALSRGILGVAWSDGAEVFLSRGQLGGSAFASDSTRTRSSIGYLTGLHTHGEARVLVWGRGSRDEAHLYVTRWPGDNGRRRTTRLATDKSDYAFRVPHRSCSHDGAVVVTWTTKERRGFSVRLARSEECGARWDRQVLRRGRRLRGFLGTLWAPDGEACYVAYSSLDDPSGIEVFRSLDRGTTWGLLPAPSHRSASMPPRERLLAARGDCFHVASVKGETLQDLAWTNGVPLPPRSASLPRGDGPAQLLDALALEGTLLVLVARPLAAGTTLHLLALSLQPDGADAATAGPAA